MLHLLWFPGTREFGPVTRLTAWLTRRRIMANKKRNCSGLLPVFQPAYVFLAPVFGLFGFSAPPCVGLYSGAWICAAGAPGSHSEADGGKACFPAGGSACAGIGCDGYP